MDGGAIRIKAALRDRRSISGPVDEGRYKGRWRVEAMFFRLKDFRRMAAGYARLARNIPSAVSPARRGGATGPEPVETG
ncbi:putative transposase [Sphingobium sp. SYK-6]|nr:putative transposase [Sphingobium sp. SYK-6]